MLERIHCMVVSYRIWLVTRWQFRHVKGITSPWIPSPRWAWNNATHMMEARRTWQRCTSEELARAASLFAQTAQDFQRDVLEATQEPSEDHRFSCIQCTDGL